MSDVRSLKDVDLILQSYFFKDAHDDQIQMEGRNRLKSHTYGWGVLGDVERKIADPRK